MTNVVPPQGNSKPAYHWQRLDRAYCEGQHAQRAGKARAAPNPHYALAAENWLAGYDDAAANNLAAFCGFWALFSPTGARVTATGDTRITATGDTRVTA